jgi:diguanylate cyclase (GGDEF)-like protein/hemerythrin-like metal-binding protein
LQSSWIFSPRSGRLNEGIPVPKDAAEKLVHAPGPEVLPGRDLLQRLPVAMLLLNEAGAALWSNDRYGELFDAVADVRVLARAAHDSAAAPCRCGVAGRNGAEVNLLVHNVPIAGARLLLLDETTGDADKAVLRDLRLRVEELERDSLTDRLTGAWNRRYLDKLMPGELAHSRRYRQPLSAAIFDIDHFKRVNDSLGHAAGDSVLRELVAVVQGGVRSADTLVRWGGEEFVLLMPFTAHGAAATAAENLRAAVAAHAFSPVGKVTISAGVAEYLPAEEPESLFSRADLALYRAKEDGRNRVEADARGASEVWAREESTDIIRLVWRDSYACGEPTIDAQHEELFRLANVLISASLHQDEKRGTLLAALDALLEHVARHFTDEEKILAARGYAKLAQHQRAHQGLLKRAGALKEAALRGDAKAGSVVEFLAHEVVAQHLLAADRDFYPLFAGAHASNPAG